MAEQTAPVVIFVLGGPGAGKGTQCANLVRDFSFVHLSAGDLLRAEMAREGSEFGELISTYIKDGQIVPMEVTLKLIQQAMAQSPGSMVLLDGFPRKMDQALEFEEVVAPCKAVLYFTCTEEVMLERLLKRGETSGRSDDNKESIVKRFQTFHETSFPVIQHYAAQNKVIEIDTLDTPDNVYLATKSQIQKLLGLEHQEAVADNQDTSEEPVAEINEAVVASEEPVDEKIETVVASEESASENEVTADAAAEKEDTIITPNSLLPELQVGNDSNLSEVFEQLNLNSNGVSKDLAAKVVPEEVAIEKEPEASQPLESAPEQLPVEDAKPSVSEAEVIEDPALVNENQTSRSLPKEACPGSAPPAQQTSGPSPKNAEGHSKKKSNCLIM